MPGARELFGDLDPERFAALGHNPTALLAELSDDELAQALARRSTRSASSACSRRSRTRRSGRRGGSGDTMPRRLPRGVLLVRVRSRREPADLLRRPRRARRRPPEVGVRARRAARRPRAPLPRGLLPAGARQGEPPGRALPRQRPGPAAAHTRAAAPSRSSSPTSSARRLGAGPGVARRRRRVPLYLLDTNVEAQPAWVRRITDALYGGDREHRIRQELVLGSRRHPRAASSRPRADGLPPERGPLRVPAARAPARARRGGRCRPG